jgi:hypothetical protein
MIAPQEMQINFIMIMAVKVAQAKYLTDLAPDHVERGSMDSIAVSN